MQRLIGLTILIVFVSMLYFGALNVIGSLILIGLIALACVYGGRYGRRTVDDGLSRNDDYLDEK